MRPDEFTEDYILTAARRAYERGFKVVFGSDVTATDDPAMQDPELKVLRKGFASVMTAKEILSHISRTAQLPQPL